MEQHPSTTTVQHVEKKESQEFIHADMPIGEVVDKYPFLAPVFMKYGLHCVGCHVSPYETLEQGSLGHGMPQEEFEAMLKEANNVVLQESKQSVSQQVTGAPHGNIIITSAAFAKAKELFSKAGVAEAEGLRIKVVPGGCSGFSYKFGFDKKREADAVFAGQDFNVFVDQQSLSMLNGAQVDYIDGLQGAGFKISNPNAASTCGCGSSFS
ncbi:iron-sulfur cluster assembly accessory protein [Candidatus Woesearchaeota archaeon]|nr:iron-sulfur cluster assembly accessory protein [Candidatus Woesearchaeota archaeon]